MNHSKRIIAIMLTVVLLVCCFASTAAFAAAAKWNIVENIAEQVMDNAVAAVPSIAGRPVIPSIGDIAKTDDNWKATAVEPVTNYNAAQNSSIGNTSVYYYSTTPWYYLPTILGEAANRNAQGVMDVAFMIPGSMLGAFDSALQRNLAATALDYADDGMASARAISDTISSIPVVGALYNATGDFGKIAVYSTALTGINASNTALLLVIQGVVNLAVVVMVPITAAAIPILTLEDGDVIIPRIVMELENLHRIYN